MMKHLTEKDLKDGEELMQILENLGEEDRKQVIIYASALKDRQLIESSKKAGQEVKKMLKKFIQNWFLLEKNSKPFGVAWSSVPI